LQAAAVVLSTWRASAEPQLGGQAECHAFSLDAPSSHSLVFVPALTAHQSPVFMAPVQSCPSETDRRDQQESDHQVGND